MGSPPLDLSPCLPPLPFPLLFVLSFLILPSSPPPTLLSSPLYFLLGERKTFFCRDPSPPFLCCLFLRAPPLAFPPSSLDDNNAMRRGIRQRSNRARNFFCRPSEPSMSESFSEAAFDRSRFPDFANFRRPSVLLYIGASKTNAATEEFRIRLAEEEVAKGKRQKCAQDERGKNSPPCREANFFPRFHHCLLCRWEPTEAGREFLWRADGGRRCPFPSSSLAKCQNPPTSCWAVLDSPPPAMLMRKRGKMRRRGSG